jgi:hypothetical protein
MGAWIVTALVFLIVFVLSRRQRPRGGGRRRRGTGAGAIGAPYWWLNDDKQHAVDIIVEGKAEERRPEYPDGNLPELEDPKPKKTD